MTWRRAASRDLWVAVPWALGAAFALALLARMEDPPSRAGRALHALSCPFRAWTDLPCLTCGATRVAASLGPTKLAQGGLVDAFRLNPLVALGFVGGLLGGALALPWVALRAPVPARLDRLPLAARAGVAAALLGNWAYLLAAARV